MRLVFVNHCHPLTPHVCAARLRDFAGACARAGHQVVLLTESLDGGTDGTPPDTLETALADHDWRVPFTIAAAPVPGRAIAAWREGRGGRLRRPLLAAAYAARGGLFTDWRDGSRPYWRSLAGTFRPQAVWASFGNTDAWAIGRAIAHRAGCPWVMDHKDPWSAFIPTPLRGFLAWRFADAGAATALSAGHAQEVRRWFGRTATVIHSGIDRDFLAPPPPPPAEPRVLVTGALYAEPHLRALVEGVRRWNPTATVVYAGAETARIRAVASAAGLAVETPGYVGLDEMRQLAAECRALLYVRNPRALYQHKLVELLALDRPVICLPEESAESRTIAATLGAAFRSCGEAAQVAAALDELMPRPVDRTALAGFTWDAQAATLVRVLEGAA